MGWGAISLEREFSLFVVSEYLPDGGDDLRKHLSSIDFGVDAKLSVDEDGSNEAVHSEGAINMFVRRMLRSCGWRHVFVCLQEQSVVVAIRLMLVEDVR